MTPRRKILIVVGTRPNIIKVTQFRRWVSGKPGLEVKIVHTGQHYDDKMANAFFEQLDVTPDFFLNTPAGSANAQIAHMLVGIEKVCLEYKPDLVMAVGDVNSTLAASLAANKLGVRLAHLEAGLRSFDRSMPEEHNRVITDHLSDIFFVTEQSGLDNLVREGKPREQIFWVGNTMIDTLVAFQEQIAATPILKELNLEGKPYVLMTMHRPANVDSRYGLERIASLIQHLGKQWQVVFPVHPRTLSRLKEFNLLETLGDYSDRLILTEPKDYFTFQHLIAKSQFVVTDSGGVQEETTFRGVTCFTLRPNTERPSTLTDGTNQLVDFDTIRDAIDSLRSSPPKPKRVPPHWDGQATARIVDILDKIL